MFKIRYDNMSGLYREAASRGHPYVSIKDAVVETTTLGTMVQRLKRNRHVREHTPVVFDARLYGCPARMEGW